MVGYMRVSTEDQELSLQRDALVNHGVHPDLIFFDKMSGATQERPGLEMAMKICRDGSVLVVWKLDRLGRSVKGVVKTLEDLEDRGVKVKSLTEPIGTDGPWAKAMTMFIVVFAEMERGFIVERTKAGIAAYKERGGKMGRPHAFLPYPKRMAMLAHLHNEEQLLTMKAQVVLDIMNFADKKAPEIKRTSSWYSWKGKGFAGFDFDQVDEVDHTWAKGIMVKFDEMKQAEAAKAAALKLKPAAIEGKDE